MCGNLALVTEGGRGYWLQLYTSTDQAWLKEVYDSAWFVYCSVWWFLVASSISASSFS